MPRLVCDARPLSYVLILFFFDRIFWIFFLIAVIIHSSSSLLYNRKDLKKVTKLEAQIPYHQGRGNKDEVEKIKGQVEAIWAKTREAALA